MKGFERRQIKKSLSLPLLHLTSSIFSSVCLTFACVLCCAALVLLLCVALTEDKGNNSWVATGAPHCNVRQDFIDTNDGIKPRVQLPVYDVEESPYW